MIALLVAYGATAMGGHASDERGPAWQMGAQVARPAALDDAWARVRGFYTDGLARHGIVGSSLSILHGGRRVAHAHWGLASQEPRQPVDEDTIFHWASITKTLTGIAIMQLRDRGRLALDDAVVKYLPELRAVHDPHGSIGDVTIRQLMSHSGGFRAATWPWGGEEPWHPHEPQRWEQLVAMLPYTQVEFRPGSRFSYSNPGIVFLGRIIEQLTLDDYEVYINKNIFSPLGMSRAYFDTAPYHLREQLSHSWYRVDGELRPARFDVNTGITVSNGGLNAPLPDMERYLSFLLGDPGRRAEYDRVLARASLEEMFATQVPIADPEQPQQRAIGLLFFREEVGGLPLIGHSGNQNGFISHLYLHLPSRAGYIVAFNTHAYGTKGPAVQDTHAFDAALRDLIVDQVFRTLR
jgi:CubicO group peptidase (beta-lactamase class C family)